MIFVGAAARLLTTVIDMAAIAKGQKIKRFPEKIIASMVIIVMMQPWPIIATASHKRRFSSCSSAQLMSLFQMEYR